MTCLKCGSGRIVAVNAKCSDLCMVTYGDKQRDGYVPDDIGIGSGDYVDFNYCLHCGQIQDEFPKAADSLESADEEDGDEEEDVDELDIEVDHDDVEIEDLDMPLEDEVES